MATTHLDAVKANATVATLARTLELEYFDLVLQAHLKWLDQAEKELKKRVSAQLATRNASSFALGERNWYLPRRFERVISREPREPQVQGVPLPHAK